MKMSSVAGLLFRQVTSCLFRIVFHDISKRGREAALRAIVKRHVHLFASKHLTPCTLHSHHHTPISLWHRPSSPASKQTMQMRSSPPASQEVHGLFRGLISRSSYPSVPAAVMSIGALASGALHPSKRFPNSNQWISKCPMHAQTGLYDADAAYIAGHLSLCQHSER